MCGKGRTGHLCTCEADGITPDILCIAKGLAQAISRPAHAVFRTNIRRLHSEQGSGLFQHGHTYDTVAAAAAIACGG